MVLGWTQILIEMSTRKWVWGEERGRRVRPTTSPPSVGRFFRQCGNFDISKPYRPPRPVTEVVLITVSLREYNSFGADI
jgi:hypothetical protein